MSWENANIIDTADKVEEIVGRPASMIMLKQLGALDAGCVELLARSPVAAFGYRDARGTSRTTFVGGKPGFARVHSPSRISFPMDENAEGPASMVFLLPGVGETLRVNGVVRRHAFDVEEVFIHCAQAVLRSGLWQPPVPARTAPEVVGDGPLAQPGVADFLATAPFLALSTWDLSGGGDTSPRGEQGAVARVLDGRTLVIADRKGNKRTDSLHNLVQDDRLSLAALVPGRTGVLHLRGRATITVDPAVLEPLALRGIPPHAALLVDVESAELTTSDAVTRSRLWTTVPADVPDLMALAGQHLAANLPKRGLAGFLVKAGKLVPSRWLRAVMNVAYRSGLRKEGYELATTAPRATREEPLREVRVAEVRRETPSAVTLVLEDGEPFDFLPGQFFTLVSDDLRRPYSASSAPGSRRLEVTVKQAGRFSAHVHSLAVGDRVSVRGPSGAFHLRPGSDVVMIAAGSGVTPMMSMIRALLAGPDHRVALLYSNRSADETIFDAELARLEEQHPDRLSVTHVVTSRDGRLDVTGIREWAGDLALPDARFYLCGPEPLMDAARQALDELGVPNDRVHAERYTTVLTSTGSTTPQRMLVESRGETIGAAVVEPGQTLLDAGLAAGLPLPYSCTVGSCGDCVVKLRAGEVTQEEPGGRVRTCTSAPLTEVILDV
ncbi:2Fe-2S iron-sulfur cluster-binding protein [Lentzea sp.]|uniref:2Fe-2S iron-sulfur cluster-binding protein n=1 Tax=Lentzea sp. TaxID=56099 RepID=UPI002B9AD8D0|nr:2Fe-2S iron-sulfur cluster-binding protein [Lentzea sp.]HUQ54993.1 2Fe-2S iron-sulfur cluster-binding protein [Lentzea sp.]